MSTKRTRELPARLVSLRERFDEWRRKRKVRSRIPEPLWDKAVKLAGTYGLHRTAKALRVNYYALKKRVETEGTTPDATTFLELAAPAPCECTMELEDAAGARMRVQLSGVATPDLVALSLSFYQGQS